jgi:hypothetical protein
MTAVTPKQATEAKAKAETLAQAAYAPMSVPLPGGETLQLCWTGRLQRAHAMRNKATDGSVYARLDAAIDQLTSQANAARDAAVQAASDYAKLALAAGQEPEELPEPACDCAGCRLGERQRAYFQTESDLRYAVNRLLLPADTDGPLPELVEILRRDDQATLRLSLQRIADAQVAYAEACKAFGQQPDWTLCRL